MCLTYIKENSLEEHQKTEKHKSKELEKFLNYAKELQIHDYKSKHMKN